MEWKKIDYGIGEYLDFGYSFSISVVKNLINENFKVHIFNKTIVREFSSIEEGKKVAIKHTEKIINTLKNSLDLYLKENK